MGLARDSLFAGIGLVKIVDPLTTRAYDEEEKRTWELDLGNSPHGSPWHTSFHASSFPGDDPEACGRKQIYTLMNIPEPEPTRRFLRSVAEAGMSIEDSLVRRWAESGVLLSAGAEEEFQTGFSDPEHWLTGSTDALILPYRWRRPHVVEVKSKAEDKVNEMKALARSYDKKHRNQCLTYIGSAHEQAHRWKTAVVCRETWRLALAGTEPVIDAMFCRVHGDSKCLIEIDLEPCTTGSIYYLSRDNPSNTHEYFFQYDPDFMAAGREKLAQWKQNFLDGTFPDRPHHEDGKVVGWSEEPCKWCPMKKHVCKPDFQNKIENLSESHAIEFTKKIRPTYDYDETRAKVLDRWLP